MIWFVLQYCRHHTVSSDSSIIYLGWEIYMRDKKTRSEQEKDDGLWAVVGAAWIFLSCLGPVFVVMKTRCSARRLNNEQWPYENARAVRAAPPAASVVDYPITQCNL
jgi:hypothetical protein